jgi:hypothetical protein
MLIILIKTVRKLKCKNTKYSNKEQDNKPASILIVKVITEEI